MDTTGPRIHPPRQARSRRTLERIMDATEALLETAAFERISIQQITTRAHVASGSFYTRFADKDAVLAALFERYLEDTETLADRAVATLGEEASLAARVRSVIELMVDTFRRRRGVSRAAQIHYLGRPEAASDEMRSRLRALYERLAEAIVGDGAGIDHPDPPWASRFAVQLVAASCRSKILFSDHPVPDVAAGDDARLANELARAVLGYLAGPAPADAPSRATT